MRRSLVCAILLGLLAPAAAAEGPFFSGTFDDACKLAGQQDKVVLVDFYTVWCGPCRMMDRSTWSNEAVKKWLGENTVAMKVDADRNRALASRYKIRSYPTMVFLRPDGSEIGRTLGFQQAGTFLRNSQNILKNYTPSAQTEGERRDAPSSPPTNEPAPTKAAAPSNAPSATDFLDRLRKGHELAAAGRHAEALEMLLWCFDHGESAGAGMSRLRLTTAVAELATLAKRYEPAAEALRSRRDAREKFLLTQTGKADRKTLLTQAAELAALNDALGQSNRMIELYDALGQCGPAGVELQRAMFGDMLDKLVTARRYETIVRLAGDSKRRIDEKIREHERYMQSRRSMQPQAKENLAAFLRQQVVTEAGKFFEALLGVGRMSEARQLAEHTLAFDTSPTTYAAFVGHAVRAEQFDAARELVDRAEKDVRVNDLTVVRKAAEAIPKS